MVPNNETFRGDPIVGVVPRLRSRAGGKDWSAKGDGERPRRLSFRVPGRTVARPDRAGTPEAAVPPGAATDRQAESARATLDAWHENLDGLPVAPPPGERASRFGRIEHARAASVAVRLPEAMLPSQIAYHMAFLEHEYAVAASFAEARAGEPGLTCNEWTRRNPFVPAGPVAAREA